MLVQDIMSVDVIVVPSHTNILEAERLLEQCKFERLPVVDNEKLVGLVTKDNLLRAAPSAANTLSRGELFYLLSKQTVKDIMKTNVTTVSPEATVESAIALAQRNRVGCLPVVHKDIVVGIVTTNDFFYKILNPLFGINEEGKRIIIHGGGETKEAEKVLAIINAMNFGVKTIWKPPHGKDKKDLVLHFDREEIAPLILKLKEEGFSVEERPFS